MKILLATENSGKIRDYCKILAGKGFQVETLATLGITGKFEETGNTFETNARGKALYYYRLAKLPTLAEDGGFEIAYLNGEPGVKSRRWLGYEASDQEIIRHLAEAIKKIPGNKRQARFVAALCLTKSETESFCAINSIEGYLTEQYNGRYGQGFPYRAHFVEKIFNRHLMDLTAWEYNQVNHRQKNIEEIIKYL